MDRIDERLSGIKQRIHQAMQSAQRNDQLKLLAVSKYHSLDKIKALHHLGQNDFGENYVSEAQEKINASADLSICWHFIGPIQSNKTRLIAELFDWVQSVDRLKIAERLNNQRPDTLPPLNICLQVNLNQEPQKAGFIATELEQNMEQILSYPKLKIRGLMAIPEQSDEIDRQRKNFARLRELQNDLNQQFHLQMDTLSMGMSGDLEAAVLEGSTMLRIGTALFGPRDY